MSTTIKRFVAIVYGATIFLAVTAFPAGAHNVAPASANSPGAAIATAAGTANALVVDNKVTGLTLRYLGLKQDDGHTVALTGAGLDAIIPGDLVAATGTVNGNAMRVTSFTRTAAAAGPGKAAAQGNAVTQLEGTLLLYHLDFFDEGRGEYGLAVATADGKQTFLNVAVIPDTLQPGMKIVATGTISADARSLDVTDISVVALPPLRASDVTANATTNNVLVMPIKFSDSPADSFTPDQIKTEFQTRVAPYYSEVSYGQQLLNVTVACSSSSMPSGCAANTMPGGWLKGSGTTPPACDWSTMGSLADAAATAAGYTVSSYQNKYYVLPGNNGCGWAGLAYVGIGLAWSANVNALWVYGHELGHNFGLWHAGSVNCGSLVIGSGCGVSEYGDPFDVMGNIRQMHFNAMQKQRLNWIPGTSVKTHTSGTQTYQLSPLETGGQSTYAVKIPTSNANRTYWVEFRQPIGFDSPLSGLPNLGAQIRVQSPFESTGGSDDTEILDLTPGDGNFDNATLLATAPAYVDSSTGVTISVNSATPGASGLLTVTVAMGGKTNTTTTLATTGTPANVGTSVTFTASVLGNAPTGNVAFTDGGTTMTGCAGVALTGSGNTRTAACSSSALTVGTHNIVATYAGDASNNPSTSATLSQVMNAAGTTNFALASNGGAAFASSTYSVYLPASSLVNGDHKGLNWGNGGGWADGTPNSFPDWVSVNFNGMKSISSVVVYTLQDNYTNPVEPTDTMTFSSYGVTDFAVQAWVGNAWQTVATVTGNNLVKKTVTFSPVTTDRIRIYITGALASSSRLTEIEAWGVNAGNLNVASVGNGAVASASSVYYTGWLPVATVNDSERAGMYWGLGNGWADGTPNAYPDWVQIQFSGQRSISSVVVYTVQDAFNSPSDPTDTMTFTTFGITDFNVQYWNGSAWVTLGSMTGNNLVKKTFNFTAVTTDRIRVNINNAMASSSRITEIEAWGN